MKKKNNIKRIVTFVLSMIMITMTPVSVLAEDNEKQVLTVQEEMNQDVETEVSDIVQPSENKEENISDGEKAEGIQQDNNQDQEDSTAIPEETKLGIKYSTYLRDKGWQTEKSNGEMAGTVGEARAIDAMKIQLENQTEFSGTIQYQAHVQRIGWQEYVNEGEVSGTMGKNCQIEAVSLKLTGELAEHYDVYYRVHSARYGWLGWTKNGEQAGTIGFGCSMQAIEIKIYEKSASDQPEITEKALVSEETLGNIIYQSHVQRIGWQAKVYDGEMSGTTGQSLNMEALKLRITEAGRNNLTGSVVYQAHVQSIGWQDEVADGEMAGTTGKSKRIEALRIKLTGELAERYDIYYRVHSAKYGWLDWAKNGEEAGTIGLGLGAQAVEVKLYEKDAADKPEQGQKSYISENNIGQILYKTHVQYIGWQNTNFVDGQTAGTTGEGRSIEALTMKVTDFGRQDHLTGSVVYQAHVQSIGWQDEVADGEMAGTTGRSKRIEAIKIHLTGELAEKYNIYYRVHSARFGWLDWTKNGEIAGTVGYSAGIEAIEIKLFEKDDMAAPQITGRSYLAENLIGKLVYDAFVEGKGWQGAKTNGQIIGTTGEARAIRQVTMKIDTSEADSAYTGNIEYRLHVAKVGWQDWKTNGDVSGDGLNQAEAVQIRLTGELEKYADVYYRTHVSNYGWLGWAKNGQEAGTTKCSYKLQAIQVKIVPKGTAAPGSNSNYYKDTKYIRMLARFSTVSTNDANGFYNMSRALGSFNGVVVNPGQTLSFFGVAGPCGQAQGYRPGGVVGGIGYGGGICQASTTLYGGAIRAGMTIIERNNHTIASTYVPRGLDAMVSYGYSDLKFRNDLGFPVTIKTYTVGNTLYVEFYGQDPGWFDFIEPVSWTSGHSAWAQRKYYKNGSVIRTENLPSSYYYN